MNLNCRDSCVRKNDKYAPDRAGGELNKPQAGLGANYVMSFLFSRRYWSVYKKKPRVKRGANRF